MKRTRFPHINGTAALSVIHELRNLLAEAEKGSIISIAYVFETHTGATHCCATGRAYKQRHKTIGLLMDGINQAHNQN